MNFTYKAIDQYGQEINGELEADTKVAAAMALQNQGLTIAELKEDKSFGDFEVNIFSSISYKEVVLMSRQISTLFSAQVSAIRVFTMLSQETESVEMGRVLHEVVADLESGTTLAAAMGKHPEVFSAFYVNMVASGEETGKLSQTFEYLADYLERNYELTSKAKNALIYPAFVISTFIGVMILMLTYIIPKIGVILTESGQELPAYTKLVLGASAILVDYGFILLAIAILVIGGIAFYFHQPEGKKHFSEVALRVPYVGTLYKKLYVSRFADNMYTMLSSGISMVRSLETTKTVIGNATYEEILAEAIEEVRGGKPLSQSLRKYPEFVPPILSQMVAVGEESGNIGTILQTLSEFYKREVTNAVDTLVGLIEPAMIVALGVGVGTLLASVLMPIYSISTGAV